MKMKVTDRKTHSARMGLSVALSGGGGGGQGEAGYRAQAFR